MAHSVSLTTSRFQYSVHTDLNSSTWKSSLYKQGFNYQYQYVVSELQINTLSGSELFQSIEMRFVLMGVSGSGKTTIGLRLSHFSGKVQCCLSPGGTLVALVLLARQELFLLQFTAINSTHITPAT